MIVEKHFYVYMPWVKTNKSIGTIRDSTYFIVAFVNEGVK